MPASPAAALQQTLPLIVLLILPLLALRLFASARARVPSTSMALGALMPWNWYSHENGGGKEREREKKRRVRTRAEQLAEKTGSGEKGASGDVDDATPLFPGLVNMSGTHCFMNSTLQALASLSYLPSHLLAIRTRAEALDVPTPVVDALLDLLRALNTPGVRPLRATALVEALCTPPPPDFPGPASPSGPKAAALLSSHEHQDAQELFQLISECVRDESARVAREAARDRGFAGAASSSSSTGTPDPALPLSPSQSPAPSPFDGLTATRRACVRCGYTAAIRHFAFDSVQLALEGVGGGAGWGGASLPALLRAYTALEVLHDCACRRCALRATARRLAEEGARLAGGVEEKQTVNGMLVDAAPHVNGVAHASEDGDGSVAGEEEGEGEEGRDATRERKQGKGKGKSKGEDKDAASATTSATPPTTKTAHNTSTAPTASRLRRLKAVRRMEARVRGALAAGRIEEEELVDGVEGGEKGWDLKGVRIERVGGEVCTRQSMVGRPPAILALHINRSVHTGLRIAKNGARIAFPELLDLAPYTTSGVLNLEPTAALSGVGGGGATVTADGDAPVKTRTGSEECLYRLAATVCHYGQHAFGHYICFRRAPAAAANQTHAPYAPAPPTYEGTHGTGAGWLRISDARVEHCGVEAVLAEGSGVFMLYYERVPPPPPPATMTAVYAGPVGGEDSAETIRPGRMGSADGEAARARVVRSVSVGVGSASVSSLSLRSASSTSSSPAPGTPRVRPAEEAGRVEGLALSHEGVGREGALPTPPPTPKSNGASPEPELEPVLTKAQKARKKKKGKGTGTAAAQEQEQEPDR
ncbi:hypothetical protein B0H10DRAFT_2101135 [Mycena sp. CBHHK59/15]|nr:hypothetical protein B0H10DRAFT_2101135 [Mycena sp. CBHHK59/15]